MNNKKATKTAFFLVAFLVSIFSFAQTKPIVYTSTQEQIPFGRQLEVLVDSASNLNTENIVTKGKFSFSGADVPIFFLNKNTLWGRFTVTNLDKDQNIFFSINYFNISKITLYRLNHSNTLDSFALAGNAKNYNAGAYNYLDYNFNLPLKKGETGTYYFKINSKHPVELPVSIRNAEDIISMHSSQSIIIAGYIGIILSIFLYNLFLFFATKDKSYLVYVFYLFALAAALLTLSGWSFKYLWPNQPWINNIAVIWTTSFAAIFAIAFAIYFLQTSTYLPKTHKFLFLIIGINIITLVLSVTSFTTAAYKILNLSAIIFGVTLIYVSATIYRKGYRPALYYLLAWSAFLVGLIVLVLRNINILPTNNYTTYVLYAGSAIEAIMLSIALADKIAILRQEKETSQADALRVSQENEKLVKEQNVLLEKKVAERTEDLQLANNEINLSYKNLKEAQIQLVEAEKMASLGQLTAGIAHEINNPINFVKGNIKPLQLDFKDLLEVINEYEKLHESEVGDIPKRLGEIAALKEDIGLDFVKEEVVDLMKGIENGAERTAEIVRGLRTFSRLDESTIKTVNIHEGIDSTLVLLRSSIPDHITIKKEYNADGNIECFPGKLNQVFMNIISNAVQSIKAKPVRSDKESVTISTRDLPENRVEISVKDTGAGMSEEVKQKIFDPFFTTKDVGEGTGLGLAIVFNIIKEHSATIEVVSAEGEGAEFKLILRDSIPPKQLK
jgi:two-component system NtrC family sensor kinase